MLKMLVINKNQKELIERIGVFFEQQGLSPAVARISGLLMVSDRLELTFDEIHTTLKISKSAASNALNLLLKTGRIEYITKPGDRKRYFKVHIDQWETLLKNRVQFFSAISLLLKEVHAQRSPDTKEFNTNLNDFISFIEFLHKEIPMLFQKWKAKK